MTALEPPDSTHLEAAQGWLDLGNHLEAREELEQVSPENRAHPDVLQVRWRVCAKAGKWEASLDIATLIDPAKLATLGPRQVDLARKLHAAGLLRDKGLKFVEFSAGKRP